MRTGRERLASRAVVAAVILLGHGGAMWLLLNLGQRAARSKVDEFVSTLIWLDSPTAPTAEPQAETANAPAAAPKLTTPKLTERDRDRSSAPISIPALSESTPAAAPTIDWESARADQARRGAALLAEPKPRGFGAVEPSRPFKKCRRFNSSFEWKTEPKKAGFGPLPYFRVGKHCVVMPPFFGCLLGELPPPNSHLLDDMNAPDRSTSSVPSEADCLPDEVQPPESGAARRPER